MTKQQFLNGKSFRSKTSLNVGSCSYKFVIGDGNKGFIEKQIRHNKTDKVILSDHHLNVTEITDSVFSGFTFVMEEQVNIKYSFKDLVVVDEIQYKQYDNVEQITIIG